MNEPLKVIITGPDVATLIGILKAAGYEIQKPKRCIGWPDCDGDLPGEDHSEKCPVKTAGSSWEY